MKQHSDVDARSFRIIDVEPLELRADIDALEIELESADQHGAVVIPMDAARRIPDAAAQIARRESHIISASQKPDFTFEKLAKALAEADEIH